MISRDRQTPQELVEEILQTYGFPIEWKEEILALYPEYHNKSNKKRDIQDLTALVCRRHGVLLPKELKRNTTRKRSKVHRGYFVALNRFKGVHSQQPEEIVKANYQDYYKDVIPIIKTFNEEKYKLGVNPAPRNVAAAAVYIVSNKSQKEIGKVFHTTMLSMRKSVQLFNKLGLYRRCILGIKPP